MLTVGSEIPQAGWCGKEAPHKSHTWCADELHEDGPMRCYGRGVPAIDPDFKRLEQWVGLRDDEHGEDTPARFRNMLSDLTSCREVDNPSANEEHIVACIKWKQFKNDGMDEMIVVSGISFTSLCNHHVVPFIGKAYVAYIPEENVCGLSKIARVVKHFGRRLQLQERMTKQIADFLEDELEPKGVAVLLEAEHLCMTIRGVQDPGTLTTTSAMRGVFSDHDRTAKAEFMQVIGGTRNGRKGS